MANETELQILIKAIDEVSGTVKDIEKTVSGMSKEVTKQTAKTEKAFQSSTDSLLALGNAASSVDRIFDSYQNLQLRLENAAIRVEEAQKNQRDAQYNLNKVMSDGTATAEDIAKAQDDLDTATNRVTVAMNNQARAGNAVVGTYINIGVQVVTLIASLPKLWESVVILGKAIWGLVPALTSVTVAGAPLWIIILAVIAALTLIGVIIYQVVQIMKVLRESWDQVVFSMKAKVIDLVRIFIETFTVLRKIWVQVWGNIFNFFASIWNSIVQGAANGVNKLLAFIRKIVDAYNAVAGRLGLGRISFNVQDVNFSGATIALKNINEEIAQINKERDDAVNSLDDILRAWAKPQLDAMDNEKKITEELKKQAELQEKIKDLTGYKVLYSRDPTTGKITYGDVYNPNAGFSQSEFESRAAYEQAKLGAGTTITIDNIYGVDPDEISEALMEKLRMKTTLGM